MLVIAAEIGFKIVSDEYKSNLQSIFKATGEEFQRVTQSASWLNIVERPPYNLKSFNHWHFHQKPYNTSEIHIPDKIDPDHLVSNLESVYQSLSQSLIKRSWPFSFSFKVLLSSICDIFSPLHLTELFNNDFPNGDNNGKNFKINFNYKIDNLFNVWETGCGLYSNNFEFNSNSWNLIDQEVTKILKIYPFPNNLPILNNSYFENIAQNTRDFTINEIYFKTLPNSQLNPSQIDTCHQETYKRIAEAGFTIASALKNINLITPGDSIFSFLNIRTSEMIAWSLFLILLPFASILIWKRHFA